MAKQSRRSFSSGRQLWLEVIIAFLIAGFFVRFTMGAMRVRFFPDELMNMFYYWTQGGWKTVLANVTFWSTFYRPMGALYYLLPFELFGLNPWAFDALRLILVGLTALLFYWLAARISGSRLIAAAATVPAAYHAGMPHLAYQGSFIYDVLCAGFYFTALLFYIRCHGIYGRLNLRQTCAFLALYICALDSKEMAVSLAVLVFSYELLFGPQEGWSIGGALSRLQVNVVPVLGAVAATVIFIAGKTHGPDALSATYPYRPVFTWARFIESNVRFLNTIFYTGQFNAPRAILIWAALLGVAIFKRDRRLMLLWVWVIVTPLPIAFLPGRGGSMVYIIAAGWFLVAAILCETLVRFTAVKLLPERISPRAVVASFLTAGVVLYAYETATLHSGLEDAFYRNSDQTWQLIQEIRALPVQPAHGSQIVFLNDPRPDMYDVSFIAALLWNDHSLTVWLQNHSHFGERDLARMNYVFDYSGGHLKQVRP
jgi:hypothetical protein